MIDTLLKKLNKVEILAKGNKVKRLLNNPLKYLYAIGYKSFVYPKKQREQTITTTLFTGRTIKIKLPASTDIYLTGGKTHDSEIRLAKFLIKNLKEGNTFWDIGAHYGYFSILASDLIGKSGKIIAIEAAPKTFRILNENAEQCGNIIALNKAVSQHVGSITFYELPNLYSEYNTTQIAQFEQEEWFQKIKVNKQEIPSINLDELRKQTNTEPNIIKIDVEGEELSVIKGGQQLLQNSNTKPLIIMEYLEAKRNNEAHIASAKHLEGINYLPHIITAEGKLEPVNDIEAHLNKNHLESDNIVFVPTKD